MAKQPDPNCPYCKGMGEVPATSVAGFGRFHLPCICTNEREPDEPATGRERVV